MSTSRDERKGTAITRLFAVLSGVDLGSDSPYQIEFAPDLALENARNALRKSTGLDEALEDIEDQINRAEVAFRSLSLNSLKGVKTDGKDISTYIPDKLCELHLTAVDLLRMTRNPDHARDHVLRAIASNPDDLRPKRYLALLCVEVGEYEDAINIIDKAVEDNSAAAFELFKLGSDLEPLADTESTRAFQRACMRDPTGLIGDVCQYRLERYGSVDGAPPSDETLNRLNRAGVDHLLSGDHAASLERFLPTVAWVPNIPLAWYGIGYAYKQGIVLGGRYKSSDASSEPSGRIMNLWPSALSLGDEGYKHLSKASHAFRISLGLDPSLAASYNELANCEVLLDRPFVALESALRYHSLRPREVAANANLSLAMLLTGDSDGALRAASMAISLDPSDPVARIAMARVTSRKEAE